MPESNYQTIARLRAQQSVGGVAFVCATCSGRFAMKRNTKETIMSKEMELVNDIFERAQKQHNAVARDADIGINLAVLVFGDPRNKDLWERMKAYCEEEM